MMRWLLYSLSILLLVQCTPKSNLPFGERLIQFGTNDAPRLADMYAAVGIQYRLDADERVLDSSWVYFFPSSVKPTNEWQQRVYALCQGERKRWDFSEEMKEDSLLRRSSSDVAFVDVQIMHCFATAEQLGNHWMDRAQTRDWEEEEIVKWFDAGQFYHKRKGMKWRNIEKPNAGLKLQHGDKVHTYIAASLLNGKSLGNVVSMDAVMGVPDQWIPAVQWAMPHLCDGDSIQLIAQSEYCFGKAGNGGLQIPPSVPIIFQIGVHVTPASVVTLSHD